MSTRIAKVPIYHTIKGTGARKLVLEAGYSKVHLDVQLGVQGRVFYVGVSQGHVLTTISKSQRQAELNLRRYFREQCNIRGGKIDAMIAFDRFWTPIKCSTNVAGRRRSKNSAVQEQVTTTVGV